MTLYDIMLEVNNFFVKEYECVESELTVTKVLADFSNTYIVGQYIRIKGSTMNDGVYKVTSVANGELMLQATLQPEPSSNITIYSLAVPASFISLANEIIAKGRDESIASESVSRYSVSYGNQGSNWTQVYKKSLDKWRKMRW
jgi:hypothetical protein